MEAHMARFRVPAGKAVDTASAGPAALSSAASASSAPPATASSTTASTTAPSSTPPSRAAPPSARGGDSTPAADRIIACERCRCYKKRCSKTPPACTACVAAGRPCSLASAVPTSLRGLRARLAWLEQFIERRALLGDAVMMSQVSTGSDLDTMANAALSASASPSNPSPATTATTATSINAPTSAATTHSPLHIKRSRDDTNDDSSMTGTSPAGTASASAASPIAKRIRTEPDDVPAPRQSYIPPSLQQTTDPWMREALVLVDAYFRDVNRSYPFLDRAWVFDVLEQKGRDVMNTAAPSFNGMHGINMNPSSATTSPDRSIDAMMVYLVMAIGRTTLQRTGKLPPDDVVSNFNTPSTPAPTSLDPTATTPTAAPTSAPDLSAPGNAPVISTPASTPTGSVMNWRPVSYEAVLALCLSEEETTDVVQLLLLLALYSLYNSCGPSTRPIVDMLARQAIRLGLTQRHLADETLPPSITERNRRIVWCIYVLDGMVCLATGMPAVLDDATVDLPLPSITVDEFASPDRPEHTTTLQAARQLIDMAKLQHAVLRAVRARQSWTNTGSGTAPVPPSFFSPPTSLSQLASRGSPAPSDFSSSSLASTHALRTAIEDWYSNGCLLRSHAEADDLRIHVTIPWLAARYYNILMLLYFPTSSGHPSPVAPMSALHLQRARTGSSGRSAGRKGRNSRPPSLSPSLLSLAQKHVQANAVRFQQRQIPLNHLTLCCIFPVLFIFFHHVNAHRPGDPPLEFRPEIDICADMMAAYPTQWPQAHRGAAIAKQLGVLVASTSSPTRAWPPTSSDRAWFRSVRLSLDELAQQVLGRGSAYRLIPEDDEDDDYYEDEDASDDAARNMAASHRNPYIRPPGQPPMHLSGLPPPQLPSLDGRSMPSSSSRLPPLTSIASVASAASVASSAPTTPYTDDPARVFNVGGSLGLTPDQASPASGDFSFMGFL
ncbi:fungal specific transcription factor [Ophiostoma piceae UAMH 11346]|uniref:Fungal specific transcription factor n=1 Tax=Ophiostoma piceae (strain UAMH 11346) TaxID=1262450 RepID=S3CQ87_OPHP1|nr:fungal specific transcription factor [Ophiostoma piceae UAMH 11346]